MRSSSIMRKGRIIRFGDPDLSEEEIRLLKEAEQQAKEDEAKWLANKERLELESEIIRLQEQLQRKRARPSVAELTALRDTLRRELEGTTRGT